MKVSQFFKPIYSCSEECVFQWCAIHFNFIWAYNIVLYVCLLAYGMECSYVWYGITGDFQYKNLIKRMKENVSIECI